MSDRIIESHIYHAEATALSGHLSLPLRQVIHPQTHVKLREEGGYLSERAETFKVEEVLRFENAYTHVGGNIDHKPGHGWSTLVTSVVEGLNILEILTADRVVAQIATHHPPHGYVPEVSFLGTRFEGLRIGGHPVNLDLDLHLLGEKPANDAPYIGESGFMERVKRQHDRILSAPDLSADIASRFKGTSGLADADKLDSIECSLVNQAEGRYPGRSFGHVIDVPNFGKIYLAVLRLGQSEYKEETRIPKATTIGLTMVDCKFGCVIGGDAQIGCLITNGKGQP